MAAEDAFRNTDGDLGERMLAGMEAARFFGGDGRCSCPQGSATSCGAPPASFEKSSHVGTVVVARIGDTNGGCGGLGCARGSYHLNLNVIGNRNDPDPVFTLQERYDTWRANRAGRPDGILSEVFWARADVITGFRQQEPLEGEPATERTEVRILYDDGSLYLGVYCFDSAGGEALVLNDVTRDYAAQQNDYFSVILDTFDDNRNGFLLGTNSGGAKRDAQARGNSTDVNFDWDTVWNVETQVTKNSESDPSRRKCVLPQGLHFSMLFMKNERVY